MLLEYLWIENFKILKDIGINFSKYFNIECEKNDKTFYVKINNKSHIMPTKFFGNKISNINIIVGSNGSGKSSLLSYLQGEIAYSGNHLHIYFDENKKTIKYISSLNIKIENHTEFKILPLYDKNNAYQVPNITKYRLARESKQLIKYIKCNLEFSPLNGANNLSDNIGKFFPHIEFDEEIEVFKKYSFKVLNSYNIVNILQLLSSINIDKVLNIKIPNKIILHVFTEKDNIILGIKDTVIYGIHKGLDPFLTKAFQYHNSILEHTEKKDVKYLVTFMLCYYLLDLINMSYIEKIDWDLDKFKECINNVNYYETYTNTLETFVKIIIPIRQEQIKLKKPTLTYSLDYIINQIYKITGILNDLSKIDDSKIRYYGKPNRFEIELNFIENKKDIFPLLLKMFKNEEYFSHEIYSIDWYGMSEGEMNILKTLAKLSYFIQRKQRYFEKTETLLVLIDEVDSSLHPDLARRFINLLIRVTELFLKNYNVKVQYILSTHSPFLVSDIPKENCVFLKKDSKNLISSHSFNENTFCGNIYTLLNNAFFMNDYSGEFARKNIENVVNIISQNKYSQNKEYVDYVLSIIGEPIIKKTILNSIKREDGMNDTN